MHLLHLAPTISPHHLLRMNGEISNCGWEVAGNTLQCTTVWMGMTVSQLSSDKGNLHLFDACSITLVDRLKGIKRTVSLHLCDTVAGWRSHFQLVCLTSTLQTKATQQGEPTHTSMGTCITWWLCCRYQTPAVEYWNTNDMSFIRTFL